MKAKTKVVAAVNGQFKIEKGIPFPKPRHTGLAAALAAMEIGDSMAISGRSISSLSVSWSRIKDKKFTARTIDNVVRVWRIA